MVGLEKVETLEWSLSSCLPTSEPIPNNFVSATSRCRRLKKPWSKATFHRTRCVQQEHHYAQQTWWKPCQCARQRFSGSLVPFAFTKAAPHSRALNRQIREVGSVARLAPTNLTAAAWLG